MSNDKRVYANAYTGNGEYTYKQVVDPNGVIRNLRLKQWSEFHTAVDVAVIMKIRSGRDEFQKIRQFLSDAMVSTYDPTNPHTFSNPSDVFIMPGEDEEGAYILMARWGYDGDRLKNGYYRELPDQSNRPPLTPEQQSERVALAMGLGLIQKAE